MTPSPKPSPTVTAVPAAYPLPGLNDDPRFTLGLVIDVAKALETHGYPPALSGSDLVRLQQSLFRFLYTLDVTL